MKTRIEIEFINDNPEVIADVKAKINGMLHGYAATIGSKKGITCYLREPEIDNPDNVEQLKPAIETIHNIHHAVNAALLMYAECTGKNVEFRFEINL